ncbi:MAG: NAD-dependent deacylase [Nitrospirae bacterium]|nr:NAD-dependent deacylase [Nitrospirota bacterium]
MLVFTGAGISAESGIPTFRGQGGIWEKYEPESFGTLPGLGMVWLTQPQRLLEFIVEAMQTFLRAAPNPAHLAIGEAERKGSVRAIVTQNIDDLHERGGSRTLYKLHGDLYTLRCLRCDGRAKFDRSSVQAILNQLDQMRVGRLALLRKLWEILPRCPSCEGHTRPDVVFFGESLPETVLAAAQEEAAKCDALLIVGTSGVVYPAALIPQMAARSGALIVEVNNEETPYTQISNYSFLRKAGEIVPKLLGM